MPITSSAKKALRVSQINKVENDLTRSKIKNAVKGVKVAVTQKKGDIPALLAAAYRELDIASKKNVIHKNKAARLKSRLAKAVSKETIVKTVRKSSAKKKIKK